MSTPIEEAALAGRMAHEMILAMEPHRDRQHWLHSDLPYLFERLREEVDELAEATHDRAWNEAADVASPGWEKDRDGETVCGPCDRWFYWDGDRCYERVNRRQYPNTKTPS